MNINNSPGAPARFEQTMIFMVATMIVWLGSICRTEAMGTREVYAFPAALTVRSTLVQGADGAFYGTTSGGGDFGYGSVFRITTNGNLTTLASFAFTNGAFPYDGVIRGSDGLFYGTTTYGGSSGSGIGYGTLFRMTSEGVLTTVVNFTGGLHNPSGGLMQASDGAFYGACAGGNGQLFRATTNGVLTRLVAFVNAADGITPRGPLVQTADGVLYGTASSGGSNFAGTVFSVTTNGILKSLASFGTNGSSMPNGPLVIGGDGTFYGTTRAGGTNANSGTVFRVTTNGALTTMASLSFASGNSPAAGLTLGLDGVLYGTTTVNGGGAGTLFRVSTNGVVTKLAAFSKTNGASPLSSLALGSDGMFYGVTPTGGENGCGVVFRSSTNGMLTALVSFKDDAGRNPYGTLTPGSDGAFYGTTENGGQYNFGTVFRITADGFLTTLVSFDSTNGAFPLAGVVEGADGAFYGTTQQGGSSIFGTLFRLTTNGDLTTLISFDGQGSGGLHPQQLVLGDDGALYGTTLRGGSYLDAGMVFRVTTDGVLTMLGAFDGTNGINPSTPLVEGTDGAFYGISTRGGIGDNGTVFRVGKNGGLAAIAYFGDLSPGVNPAGGLVQGSDGAFYGTTTASGGYGGGAVFRLTTNGDLSLLAPFPTYLGGERSRLLQASDGALYGTVASGFIYSGGSFGTVFRVTMDGVLTSVAALGYTNGANPYGGLAQSSDASIYGVCFDGGGRGGGNIFRLDLSGEMQLPIASGDAWDVSFTGLPEVTYRIQRASALTGPWNTVGNVMAGTNGSGTYTDTDPLPSQAFYRAVAP